MSRMKKTRRTKYANSRTTVTDPPLKALRRVIPPLRLGNFSIDLGFMVLLFGVYLLMTFVGQAARTSSL